MHFYHIKRLPIKIWISFTYCINMVTKSSTWYKQYVYLFVHTDVIYVCESYVYPVLKVRTYMCPVVQYHCNEEVGSIRSDKWSCGCVVGWRYVACTKINEFEMVREWGEGQWSWEVYSVMHDCPLLRLWVHTCWHATLNCVFPPAHYRCLQQLKEEFVQELSSTFGTTKYAKAHKHQ